MTSALTHYYGLRLWTEYLEAKAQWEHAHAEYVAAPMPIPKTQMDSVRLTAERMYDLLTQLRATPEHLEAFGW